VLHLNDMNEIRYFILRAMTFAKNVFRSETSIILLQMYVK